MTEETVNPKSAYMLVYRRTQPLGEGWALARQLAAPDDEVTYKDKGLGQGVAMEKVQVNALGDGIGGGVVRAEPLKKSMRGPLKRLIQEVHRSNDNYIIL